MVSTASEIVFGVEGIGLGDRLRRHDIRTDGTRRHSGGIEQDRGRARSGDLTRDHQRELIEEALRVLDDAHHFPSGASLMPDVADTETEFRCHPGGECDFAG
jgi:hypothetical protein